MKVVCFLLGDSPASDLYMPTFRNTLSVPSSKADVKCVNQTPGNQPKENKQHSEHGKSLKSRIINETPKVLNSKFIVGVFFFKF